MEIDIGKMFAHGEAVGALKEHEYAIRLARKVQSDGFKLDVLIAQLKRRRPRPSSAGSTRPRARTPAFTDGAPRWLTP